MSTYEIENWTALDQLALAERVLKQVTDFPDEHSQGSWESVISLRLRRDTACRTTRCVAGWAVYYAGGRMARDYPGSSLSSGRVADLGHLGFPNGSAVPRVARELLGLRTSDLFYRCNERAVEELGRHVEALRRRVEREVAAGAGAGAEAAAEAAS